MVSAGLFCLSQSGLAFGLSELLGQASRGVVMVVFPQGCPLGMVFIVALYYPWCWHLEGMPYIKPQLYADSADMFTVQYVRSVGQYVSPGKCVLLSTSKSVRRAVKLWGRSLGMVSFGMSQLDIGDLGGHLDFTKRARAGTFCERVGGPTVGVAAVGALPLGFSGQAGVGSREVSSYLPGWSFISDFFDRPAPPPPLIQTPRNSSSSLTTTNGCFMLVGLGILGLVGGLSFLVNCLSNSPILVGWLTCGDLAMDSCAQFLAVAEHRLIPARARSVGHHLRKTGFHSVWAPACQDSIPGGHAGVGVVSLGGAPLALPSFVTPEFRKFFRLGRVLRTTLPTGKGGVVHLFVVYGYQGAEDDAEKLGLTDKLLQAVLAEARVVCVGQPMLIAGDLNADPAVIPCLAKGMSAGRYVDLALAHSLGAGLTPDITCTFNRDDGTGSR